MKVNTRAAALAALIPFALSRDPAGVPRVEGRRYRSSPDFTISRKK